MAIPERTKVLALFVAAAVIVCMAGTEAIQYWWYYGYSQGQRTGVVRKIRLRGPFLQVPFGRDGLTGRGRRARRGLGVFGR